MDEALQWWYQKVLKQLESEANLIREQLLQESFAVRRSLELSSLKPNELASLSCQKCVAQLEDFHFTLKELSDRLSPPYLNEGLPFALQYLVTKWREQLPLCQFELNSPLNWRQKFPVHNSIILNTLAELLRIQLTENHFYNLTMIDVKQNQINHQLSNQLKITFVEPGANKDLSKKHQQELKYIQKSFEYLTLGSCQNTLSKVSNIWYFKW